MTTTKIRKQDGMTKTEIKDIAKRELLHALANAPYAIADDASLSPQEKEVILTEMRRQARRMRNIIGYE